MPTPNFEYDLFISYAHIDNQHYSEVPQGWVDYLHERLQVSLSKRLGRAPRIWRDRKLRGNDVFDDEIKQTLAKTAIFLPVMSPRYLESTSCRAEVQDFARDVLSVAFSPDGKVVASGSSDNTIRLWDVGTGKALATLKGHANTVNSVAFAPNGKALASGSLDGTVKLWDLDTRQTLVTLQGHVDEVYSVAFAPDSRTLASGGEDKTVRVYFAATEEEVGKQRGRN